MHRCTLPGPLAPPAARCPPQVCSVSSSSDPSLGQKEREQRQVAQFDASIARAMAKAQRQRDAVKRTRQAGLDDRKRQAAGAEAKQMKEAAEEAARKRLANSRPRPPRRSKAGGGCARTTNDKRKDACDNQPIAVCTTL